MPRHAKGPRLWLRSRAGRSSQWVILDHGREHRTGCGAGDRPGAEQALARYIQAKYRPQAKGGHLASLRIADVVDIYLREHAPNVAEPAFLGATAAPIIAWWGTRTLADIRGQTCRDYVAWRTAQIGRHGRPVSDQTARHDLKTLRAAIGYYHREHGPLDAVPAVTIPERSGGKDRWLTRSEAARLLWAARRSPRTARFVLLGLHTGTRRDAILALRWAPSDTSGWIDLDAGVLHRAGKRERATKKRRPSCRIPVALLPFLRRWRAADMANGWDLVCHDHGRPNPASIRTGFAAAVRRAGLGPDVTPHTLRHTCATWLMHDGVPVAEAAGFVGLSIEMFDRVYGHHSTDHSAVRPSGEIPYAT